LSTLWSKVYPLHAPYPRPAEVADSFPFGVAIALGTYLTLAASLLGKSTLASLFV
jgi:hypothetical protein